MTAALAAAAAGFAAGGVVGWFVVPPLADKLLGRSHARTASWWWESCEAYTTFKREHRAREPCAGAGGEEGVLAVWRDDALAAAREGSLARERAAALAEAGCSVNVSLAVRDEAAQRERRSFDPTPLRRGACALGCALWFSALAASGLPWAATVAFALCGVAMAAAVACDMRARIIPIEACLAIALAGIAVQALMGGATALRERRSGRLSSQSARLRTERSDAAGCPLSDAGTCAAWRRSRSRAASPHLAGCSHAMRLRRSSLWRAWLPGS